MRAALKIWTSSLILASILTGGVEGSENESGNSNFFTSPDGLFVRFDVRGVSRRAVFDKLLADKPATVEWSTSILADEKITGVFEGNFDSILKFLLKDLDHVIVYDQNAEKRILRITILRKQLPESNAAASSRSYLGRRSGHDTLDRNIEALSPPSVRATPPKILPSAGPLPPGLVPPRMDLPR
jgi:hypothetical protein